MTLQSLVAGTGRYVAACGAAVLLASRATPETSNGGVPVPAGAERWIKSRCKGEPQRERRWCPMEADSPDVVIVKRLLDHLKLDGFQFRRIAPGEDGPLMGNRATGAWIDLIHIEGFSHDCFAWRKQMSPLIASESALIQHRVEGSALEVPRGLLVHTHRHGYQHTAPCRGSHPHRC